MNSSYLTLTESPQDPSKAYSNKILCDTEERHVKQFVRQVFKRNDQGEFDFSENEYLEKIRFVEPESAHDGSIIVYDPDDFKFLKHFYRIMEVEK